MPFLDTWNTSCNTHPSKHTGVFRHTVQDTYNTHLAGTQQNLLILLPVVETASEKYTQ